MAEISIVAAVIAVRLLTPFLILKWRFWGMVLCIIADTFDLTVLKAIGWDRFGFADYQLTDKLFDLYYLTFGLFVTSELPLLMARRTLQVTYFWRFAGVILFEVTGFRWILFAAPNIFEPLYLLLFGTHELLKKKLSRNVVILFLLVSAIVKIPQEYVMHYLEFRWGFGNFFDGVEQLIDRDSRN